MALNRNFDSSKVFVEASLVGAKMNYLAKTLFLEFGCCISTHNYTGIFMWRFCSVRKWQSNHCKPIWTAAIKYQAFYFTSCFEVNLSGNQLDNRRSALFGKKSKIRFPNQKIISYIDFENIVGNIEKSENFVSEVEHFHLSCKVPIEVGKFSNLKLLILVLPSGQLNESYQIWDRSAASFSFVVHVSLVRLLIRVRTTGNAVWSQLSGDNYDQANIVFYNEWNRSKD